MNKNIGLLLVFIALILLSVLVVNGLYFNNPAGQEQTAELNNNLSFAEDTIKTNLSINQTKEYVPEIADVVIGFENESASQATAVEANNKVVNNLMALLESNDLEKVATDQYRVYPYTRYNDNDQKTVYYRVTNQIKFTTSDLDRLPVLIAQLLNAGANRVVSLNYDLRDNNQALNEVTTMAINSLKEKAKFMADNLGKENYRIKEINFGNQNIYRVNLMKSASRADNSQEFSEVPLAKEDVEINVSLSAEIELY